MNKLKQYKLSDLYEMSSGISTKKEQAGHGASFVSFGTVYNNYFLPFELQEKMDTSEYEQEKYSIKKGDIFLTRTSETINELAMSSVALKDYPNATYSGFTKRLRPLQNDITYDKYMGFYLRSIFFRKTMTNNAVLTTRASFNEEIFSYLDLYLPDFETQVRNGDLLYLLNEKIEINNKINSELEAMAKTLYDYWFVQFDFPNEEGKPYKSSGGAMEWNEELKREIPVGCEVIKLDSIFEFEKGVEPGSSEYSETSINEDYVKFYRVGDIHSDSELYIDSSVKNYTMVNENNVIVTFDGSVGKLGFGLKGAISGGLRKIYDKNNKYSNALIYIIFCDERIIATIHKYSTGSILLHASSSIEHLVIPFYESKYIEKKKIVNPIFDKMVKNKLENQELASLRDWLLPMLMNGQVSVK